MLRITLHTRIAMQKFTKPTKFRIKSHFLGHILGNVKQINPPTSENRKQQMCINPS